MGDFVRAISTKLTIPVVLLMILAMVILPLPPLLLDAFFTFNIMLAIVVLLVSSTVSRVLEFSVFPSLLLVATLLRLTLNVASTRVVLLEAITAEMRQVKSFNLLVKLSSGEVMWWVWLCLSS